MLNNYDEFREARKAAVAADDARRLWHISILERLTEAQATESMAVIDEWEKRGVCSRCYIDGWRKILLSEDRLKSFKELALNEEGDLTNAFTQNTPLRSAYGFRA
ncbi:hypothetical protein [Ferrovum sp.]|jgi:hypothetical protein|uniref:hypothetical protein n=1 Tax=Ferrovum sp. TaxID=2609467 RepID=UPI0026026547|nr:hypothetical protein [Ferrovum sp.]